MISSVSSRMFFVQSVRNSLIDRQVEKKYIYLRSVHKLLFYYLLFLLFATTGDVSIDMTLTERNMT